MYWSIAVLFAAVAHDVARGHEPTPGAAVVQERFTVAASPTTRAEICIEPTESRDAWRERPTS